MIAERGAVNEDEIFRRFGVELVAEGRIAERPGRRGDAGLYVEAITVPRLPAEHLPRGLIEQFRIEESGRERLDPDRPDEWWFLAALLLQHQLTAFVPVPFVNEKEKKGRE